MFIQQRNHCTLKLTHRLRCVRAACVKLGEQLALLVAGRRERVEMCCTGHCHSTRRSPATRPPLNRSTAEKSRQTLITKYTSKLPLHKKLSGKKTNFTSLS